MLGIRESLQEVFHIFFRHYNFPCELRLIPLGTPHANSPVFLSGNYTLTVNRLLRRLKGTDCYLLVANSRGSNVWCAAGMNEFSEHDVVDAINVSRLNEVVRHRQIIAPPYAAPGVDVRFVKQQTGFSIKWGPTHLDDIPRYIKNGYKRTNDMLQAKFGLQDRLEQALSTSLAYCMTIGITLIFWPTFILKVMGLIFLTYLYGFVFYYTFPEERRWRRTITIALTLSAGLVAVGLWRNWTASDYLTWEAVLLSIVLLLAMDACGSSAVYKSTVAHWLKQGDYHSLFDPVIDPKMCTNCMACVLVCPKDVFAARRNGVKTVVAVKPTECIECMACVKQCYDDAIFNRSGKVKGDVKSIPNLHYLMGRDWSHLKDEDRWISSPITIRNGLPVVVEHTETEKDIAVIRRADELSSFPS